MYNTPAARTQASPLAQTANRNMATSYFERAASPSAADGAGSLLSPTSPGAPAAAPRSSALQNRITSVLSSSFADLEIRDALSILDARGVQNTAEARRNLRLDVQQELIECNGEIVQDFGLVAEQLQRVGAAIQSLNTSCAEMRKHISAANRETGPMLDDAESILQEKRQVETKQQLLDAFKAHFVVDEADLATLTSTAEPVNDEFFRILTRVKKIHQDSQVLLGAENQRLGLEILEQSSRHLNAAFQKLYRWVQREFKSLDLENPQISTAIRRALRVLAERPALFQNCLDFFAEARETTMSNNFYAALTGAPVDQDHPVMGKAIELSAHDPLRYVSDMLAWAHAATVSEREALEVLFISEGDEIAKSIQAGIESEPWARPVDGEEPPVFDGRKALSELVERDLAGVFRQLRQRTEQVIQSHEDAPLAYKISNLLLFYRSIFTKLLGDGSALLDTLTPLADAALRSFRTTTRDHVASLHGDLALTPATLHPPDFLRDALATLHSLLQSYAASIPTTPADPAAPGLQPLLHEALDPYLLGCDNLAARLPPPHSHILTLNCLMAARATLAPYPFTAPLAATTLTPRLAEHERALVAATHAFLLRASGLAPLVETLHTPDDFFASAYNNDDHGNLAALAQQLDAFLPTATEEALGGFLGQVGDRAVARGVVAAAAERFCGDFERVEGVLVGVDEMRVGRKGRRVNGVVEGEEVGEKEEEEEEGGEKEEEEGVRLREVFPRTGDEIRVLLS